MELTNNIMEPIWPEIFETGVVPDDYSNAALCADGLLAWGICMSGTAKELHPNFGKVLAEISMRLGVSATSEGLMEYSSTILK